MQSGLVDSKKAKKLGKAKRKQQKQANHHGTTTEQDQIKTAAQAALAEKSQQDKTLAAERNKIEENKQIIAQIKQLISSHKIDIKGGNESYQFVDDKKVKKIVVTCLVQRQLIKGLVAIAADGDSYAVVPAKIAEKIRQRDDGYIKLLNEATTEIEAEEDDPYADYPIPDDLMW